MQWNGDRNAGFSAANPQRLYLPVIIDPEYHSQAVNVEAQQENPNSLLWWMKRLIAAAPALPGLRPGHARDPAPRQPQGASRSSGASRTSGSSSSSTCRGTCSAWSSTCREFRGAVPVELFGEPEFPAVGDLPYFITLGPHGFYWFSLESEPDETVPR